MQAEAVVTLNNEYGLHARPATLFVELCNRFDADVVVSRDGREVNGKSVMGVMMLGAECGATLTIQTDGPDAEDALRSLVELVESGFGES